MICFVCYQGEGITLDRIFGYIFTPLAVLMGVDSDDYITVGCLLGQKTLLNEFVAFQNVASIQDGFSDEFAPMSARSLNIVTYLLCGIYTYRSIRIGLYDVNPTNLPLALGLFSDMYIDRSRYALCGFSNIGSVGMTMSAMTAIAPGQTKVVNEVVIRSLIAGCCANFLNAVSAT